MIIKLPLTKEAVKDLRIGDVVELSGDIYTARDAAHKRMVEGMKNGVKPPIELMNQTIFYTGPCPTKPGHIIGSLSPTTSLRMDTFVEPLLKEGVVAMIGKGNRSDYVAPLCKQYGAVYFLAIGGAAAVIASYVKNFEVVAYEDLGTESIKRLTFDKIKVIVGIDPTGAVLQDEEIAKYKIV